jgi:hypothetical protein
MLAVGYEAFVYTTYTVNARGQFDSIVSKNLIDKLKKYDLIIAES